MRPGWRESDCNEAVLTAAGIALGLVALIKILEANENEASR